MARGKTAPSDYEKPSASELLNWQPKQYPKDSAEKGRLTNIFDEFDTDYDIFGGIFENQNEEPSPVAAEPVAPSEPRKAESPPRAPRRRRSTNSRWKKEARLEREAIQREAREREEKEAREREAANDVRMANTDDNVDGGVLIVDGSVKTPEQAPAPAESPQRPIAIPKPKIKWNGQQKKLFSEMLRPIDTEKDKNSSPPEKTKDEVYRFTFGEHIGKTMFDVLPSYLLELRKSDIWETNPELEEAYQHYWLTLRPEEPRGHHETRHPRSKQEEFPWNWRIPESCKSPYARWLFKNVPREYRLFLSHEMVKGNRLTGEWAPMRQAFEYYCPNELPGPRLRAMDRAAADRIAAERAAAAAAERAAATAARNEQTARNKRQRTDGEFAQPPPKAPRADREQATSRASSRASQAGGISLCDPEMFSLGPRYFTFPERCAFAYKRFDALTTEEQNMVLKMVRAGKMSGPAFNGLKEAIQANGITV